MLNGASEKSTMDLFFSEVGRRFGEWVFLQEKQTSTLILKHDQKGPKQASKGANG